MVLARRDTGEKEFVSWEELPKRVPALLEQIQSNMLAKVSLKSLYECLAINICLIRRGS